MCSQLKSSRMYLYSTFKTTSSPCRLNHDGTLAALCATQQSGRIVFFPQGWRWLRRIWGTDQESKHTKTKLQWNTAVRRLPLSRSINQKRNFKLVSTFISLLFPPGPPITQTVKYFYRWSRSYSFHLFCEIAQHPLLILWFWKHS